MKLSQIIILPFISLLALTSCGTDKDRITPYRGKVKFETVSLSSKLAGRVEKIYVLEGQKVKKGDTLAYINIPEVSAKMLQVEGAIQAAEGQLNMANNGATKEQLRQIKGKLDAGKAQLKFAQESYNRLSALHSDSLVPTQQLEEVKMKLEMAQAQDEAIQAKYDEVKKGVRFEQVDQAKGMLNKALGAKEELETASAEKYILAPSSMTIETISLNVGELLTPGYSLFSGYSVADAYFRFSISEANIYKFNVGDELKLENPYTKKEIDAKIIAIKQLPKYADISSTSPLYELTESVYELKMKPLSYSKDFQLYANATLLIKE